MRILRFFYFPGIFRPLNRDVLLAFISLLFDAEEKNNVNDDCVLRVTPAINKTREDRF